MKKIAFILLTLTISFGVFAQTDSTEYPRHLLLIYGIQSIDITELNTVLKNNKYPLLNKNNYSIGIEWLEFLDRIVWASNIYNYSQNQRNDTMTSSLSTWAIGQSYGYVYLKRMKFNMYSTLGWDYSTTTVKVTKDIASNTSFNSYASSIGNQIEMTSNMVLLKIETNINFILNISKSTKNKRVVLGIRGGYHFPIKNTKWKMDGITLDNSPNTNLGGYYAMLNIGYRFK